MSLHVSASAGGNDEDEANGERIVLERHLRKLDNVVFSLQAPSGVEQTHSRKKVRFNGKLLLGSILASQGMRNKAKFRESLKEKMIPLLPPVLRHLLNEMESQGTLKTPQWDSSRQLILDVAAMRVRRKQVQNGPSMVRFGFADSSLQALICDCL